MKLSGIRAVGKTTHLANILLYFDITKTITSGSRNAHIDEIHMRLLDPSKVDVFLFFFLKAETSWNYEILRPDKISELLS